MSFFLCIEDTWAIFKSFEYFPDWKLKLQFGQFFITWIQKEAAHASLSYYKYLQLYTSIIIIRKLAENHKKKTENRFFRI